MKKALSVLLLLGGLVPARAELLVTDVVGVAELEGRGPVKTLDPVGDGGRLAIPAGGRVTAVDLATGREYLLGPGKYAVQPSGPRSADGKPVEARALPAQNLPPVRIAAARAGQATLVMRSLRKANIPVPLAPVRAATLTDTPEFRWAGVEGAGAYRLTLSRREGGLLWEATVREVQAALPADRRLAAGEHYVWRVEALGEGAVISDASAGFWVAPAEAMERLNALRPGPDAPFARRVLYAAQLREAGVRDAAREEWKRLVRERPDDPVLKELAE
ncbi:MAG: hypothetical protein JNM82_14545 [Rhodocyclaceae bacterium]|nr:hypothetical protein [Rhodocyclaceae bacterium]